LKTLKKVYSEICCVGGVDKWQNKTDIQADNAFSIEFLTLLFSYLFKQKSCYLY